MVTGSAGITFGAAEDGGGHRGIGGIGRITARCGRADIIGADRAAWFGLRDAGDRC